VTGPLAFWRWVIVGWHRAIPAKPSAARTTSGLTVEPCYNSMMEHDSPDEIEPGDVKQVIVIRRDLKMRRGKEIAQGSHASTAWLTSMVADGIDPVTRSGTVTIDPVAYVWMTTSHRKITLQVHDETEIVALHEAALSRGLRSHLITDSGRTEFGGVPTITALAIGPDRSDLIDEVTGALAIY
jgi:peptidyl-tRNA hydrolase, PTH2 family